MKSYYCKRLFEDINFSVEKVYICSGFKFSDGIKAPEPNEDIDSYLKKMIIWRENIYNQALKGKIPPQCIDCIELQKNKVSIFQYMKNLILKKQFIIKNIVVKSYRQCEYSCVYCLEHKYTKGKQTKIPIKSEYYDFLPVFKSLIQNKMIDHNVRIEFQGGSISVLEEFEDILKEIEKFGVAKLWYHTNAYKFIPQIAELAKKIPSEMSISIDSGTRETYNIVKNSDSFDLVKNNIINYAQAGINCTIKYIIVRNINDNIAEIKNFCETVKELKNLTDKKDNIQVMLEVDFRESLKEGYRLTNEYKELFKYTEKFCLYNFIPYACQPFIEDLLRMS